MKWIFALIIVVGGYCHEPSVKVAVCYWGLTRSTRFVYPSHFDRIFRVLETNGIGYDVFMHTWSIEGKQWSWDQQLETPVDYEEYQFLKPKYYKIEPQSEFLDRLDFSQYYYQGETEWLPQLIRNHLCALESQKRVTDMVTESGNHYDFIIYVRPDVWFRSPLDVGLMRSLKEGEIVVPSFDSYGGYNDRFAILPFATAPIYGKRIDEIAQFRRDVGYIVSEKYVKYICDKYGLKVHFSNIDFVFVRP